MKHAIRILSALLLSFVLAVMPAGCVGRDDPPDADTPEPPAHSGVYVCGDSRLVFDGNGESVSFELAPELAAAAGLPENEPDGSYVFLFFHQSYRYDKAESFRLCAADGSSYDFMNSVGETSESVIALVSPLDASVTLRFERSDG